MASTTQIPTIALPGDVTIPQFGLGVFQVPPEDTVANVTYATEAGYRHIDTARAYDNEAQVGEAVRASGLSREEFLITTNLWKNTHTTPRGPTTTKPRCARPCAPLGCRARSSSSPRSCGTRTTARPNAPSRTA